MCYSDKVIITNKITNHSKGSDPKKMKLRIITPNELLFEGDVESVTLPGTVGSFTVLNNHAPIISSLETGKISYKDANGKTDITVKSGFAEVQNNVLSVCVEL